MCDPDEDPTAEYDDAAEYDSDYETCAYDRETERLIRLAVERIEMGI